MELIVINLVVQKEAPFLILQLIKYKYKIICYFSKFYPIKNRIGKSLTFSAHGIASRTRISHFFYQKETEYE